MTDISTFGNIAAAAVLGALQTGGPDGNAPVTNEPAAYSTAWAIEEQWVPEALPPNGPRILSAKHAEVDALIMAAVERYSTHVALARTGISSQEFRCWLLALIKQESRFSARAKSPKEAFGLTQIIPSTARHLGIYPEYYDSAELQVDGGARYLLAQLEKFGSMPLALAAYNAGPQTVEKYGRIPPYKETQGYVAAVISYYNEFALQLGGVKTIDTLGPHDLLVADAAAWIAEGPRPAQAVPAEDWHPVNLVGRSAPVVLLAEEGPAADVDKFGPDEQSEKTERDQDPFTAGTRVNIRF
jgi:hypothetical protein